LAALPKTVLPDHCPGCILHLGGTSSSVSEPRLYHLESNDVFKIARILQNLFCTNCFIPRFDLGLVVQNHVQQGIMDFQFSVVFDKTQFAEFVHEKA
jgi:hypothetical protein